ncbi:MAG: hypothetical protein JWM00_36 [Candidatus Saccharibacteria bacterium]|nr:hypothetical protein [Candidatus Saccharibacteria bacterium]
MKYHQTKNRQQGAVSLFVVIFTALLVIIVTVGFVQLMVRNQQQATQSDLSQSAYDSALAGVEDAKRAMVISKKCASDPAPTVCQGIDAKLDSQQCSTLSAIFDGSATDERKIQQSVSDESLDQAYTCVKIIQNTPDYTRKGLQPGKSHLIPLRVAPGESFDKIEIKWFTRDDISEDFSGDNTLPANYASMPFPMSGDDTRWGKTAPPLLRTQLIKTGSSFTLSSLETTGGLGNANTLFLYPTNIGLDVPFSADPGIDGPIHSTPQSVKCNNSQFSEGDYACTVTLTLPEPTSGAYLRLSALYNKTRYKVVMKNGDAVVRFHGVQPEVDSTGRANDLFRRVNARIQFESTDFPYPEDAVDLYGSLCKDFSVTSKIEHYDAGRCNVAVP